MLVYLGVVNECHYFECKERCVHHLWTPAIYSHANVMTIHVTTCTSIHAAMVSKYVLVQNMTMQVNVKHVPRPQNTHFT